MKRGEVIVFGRKKRKKRRQKHFHVKTLETGFERRKRKLGEELGRENPTIFAVEFAEIR
jgi:hypothetical protein